MSEVVHFYQTGTFTVGNRLVTPEERAGQASMERTNALTSGHRACQGCGEALGARYAVDAAMRAVNGRLAAANATGCLEVFSTPYPETSWQLPWFHSLFGNTAAVATGMAAAFKVKAKKSGGAETRVIAMGGDGGTTDIGFGCLSGMFERNDDVLYICYDNEAYMNTGIQKSSLTPFGASTTTTPAGKHEHGCLTQKKSLFDIVAAHRIPYAATASVGYLNDFTKKVERARDIKGTRFIHVMAPCPVGWGFPSADMVDVAKEIVDTGLWYLAEYEGPALTGAPGGTFHLNRDPKSFKPIEPYLRRQGRFSADDGADLALIERARDERWSYMRETWG